jgi:ApaG protein
MTRPATESDRGQASADGQPAEFIRITRDIRVSVRAMFLEQQSVPDERQFLWAYRIRIENLGGETVQLMRRTWRITDGAGQTNHVTGDGVVGEQPVLPPGETFEYTSGTSLGTPGGFMSGQYHMRATTSDEPFDIVIPTFSLDSPHQPGIVH